MTRAWKKPPERIDENAQVGGRVPPHDLDMESAVLSACILEGRIDDVAHKIPSDAIFYSPANRRIWQALVALSEANAKIDAVTVAGWLKSRERLAEVGGTAYIAKVTDSAPVTSHIETYAERVGELWQRRLMIATAQKIAAEAYGDVGPHGDWLSQCEADIIAVGDALTRAGDGMQPIDGILRGVVENLASTKAPGLSSGLRDLDALTSGLHGGEVTVVGARPGMGKTSFMLDLSMSVADKGRGVGVFSLEMPKEQIGTRMLCSASDVNLMALRTRNISTADWAALHQGLAWLKSLPIRVDDTPAPTLIDLMRVVRRTEAEFAREGKPLGLIAIDYLQLARGVDNEQSREQEISRISRGCKIMAKTFRVPVLVLSQLNRGVETRSKDQRPKLADLRESGAIEQDADTVILLYRDDYYDKASGIAGIAEIDVAKQRNGPTGTVAAAWRAHCAQFADVDDEQRRMWDLSQENTGKKGAQR